MLHDKDHLSIEASKFLSDDLKLFIDKNCLGKLFLDKGHNLAPCPPHNITGKIFLLFLELSSKSLIT